MSKTIGFFVRHFTERGTEVAIYDYAKYNEDILNNKSYIICFTQEKQQKINFPTQRFSYDKFKNRFQIIEISDMNDMSNIIKDLHLDYFYTLTYGGSNDIYQFNNKALWGNCKTIKHCVFETTCYESDFYISISNMLNQKNSTSIPVIPHIVDLPNSFENLKNDLHIPNDAIVFGRYGGFDDFNIQIAHDAIKQYLQYNENAYFLFMNTARFYEHPRIIYLDKNLDLYYKVKFINTCDAMIHAREMGETFGLSIAEFSIKNKPVITCKNGDLEHIYLLGDKAIVYNSTEELMHIFKNIGSIINSRNDWNAYREFSPEKIMNLFKLYIFDKNLMCINMQKTIVDNFFGFKYTYFINDCMASTSIGINKEWEPHIKKFTHLYNILYNITNIIDIGANFGYHTLIFSRECSANVYAFEPQIQNFQLLQDNVKNNNINNIILYNYACGDYNCEIKMPIYNINNNINMGDITPNIDCINNKFSITQSVLLDEIDFPSKIDLIKIDVQGWEKKVLIGADKLLKIHKPVLIVEFEDFQLIKTNTTCKELFDYIREQDYYIFYLEYCYPSDHVCIHNENLKDFRIKFKNYIFPHIESNNINYNLLNGVNEKIVMV